MSEAVLFIFYFSLNAFASLLYMIGDTSLIFKAIQPAVPVVCWSCAGFAVISAVLVGLVWIRNNSGLKLKTALSILTSLFIPNIVFVYLMNGMKF